MISEFAIVEEGAVVGDNCSVGPFTVIHTGTKIGDNVTIESFCDIGVKAQAYENSELVIGQDSLIRSHSVIYSGSVLGQNLSTGHRVTIRENSAVGTNVQIGTLSDIQGDCSIGNFTRLHSNVHIGKQSRIGNYVWLYPYVVLTNDPHPPSDITLGVTIEDFAVISTMSVILPGVNVGGGSLVAAHSLVTKDVLPERLVAGVPARVIKNVNEILYYGTDNAAYPWPSHFSRGYPENILDIYKKTFHGNEK
jgi:acetyltransferase-like isoleucine patch superfamily enzyme